MRKFGKVDRNHAEVIAALRRAAIAAWSTAPLGDGFADILAAPAWNRRFQMLLEVKMPGEKLTKAEQEFHATWPGPLAVVFGPEDAVRAVVDAAGPGGGVGESQA